MAKEGCVWPAHVPPHVVAWRSLAWLTAILVMGGCEGASFLQDPFERAKIAALGPEDPSVAAGPLHRPGQPCAACHSSTGGAVAYSAAGTVYRDPLAQIPVADVVVSLVDGAGKIFTTKTNCVGSFYVKSSEFAPTYPLWVSVQLGEFPWKMSSPIHREASCAECHLDPAGPAAAGHVFLTDDDTTLATIPLRPCADQDSVRR